MTSSTVVSKDRSICPADTPFPSGSTLMLIEKASSGDSLVVDAGSMMTDGAAMAAPIPNTPMTMQSTNILLICIFIS